MEKAVLKKVKTEWEEKKIWMYYTYGENIYTSVSSTQPERIYNPITAMGFLAMFTFQLDITKR